jgi:hypothetical protein
MKDWTHQERIMKELLIEINIILCDTFVGFGCAEMPT